MNNSKKTIDFIAGLGCMATKKVFEASTGKTIKYSTTIQSVPKVSIRPEIGCFVQFSGDYNGLVVMNFSKESALTLYRSYMLSMGMPESELAKEYTSTEVPDSIGEMVNQVMGKMMRMVEAKYLLTSFFGQPKALALNSAITLTIDSDYRDNRRMTFIVDGAKFYMELAMESTEFISIRKKTVQEVVEDKVQ